MCRGRAPPLTPPHINANGVMPVCPGLPSVRGYPGCPAPKPHPTATRLRPPRSSPPAGLPSPSASSAPPRAQKLSDKTRRREPPKLSHSHAVPRSPPRTCPLPPLLCGSPLGRREVLTPLSLLASFCVLCGQSKPHRSGWIQLRKARPQETQKAAKGGSIGHCPATAHKRSQPSPGRSYCGSPRFLRFFVVRPSPRPLRPPIESALSRAQPETERVWSPVSGRQELAKQETRQP